MDCTIKEREYKKLELTQFREEKKRGEIILSCGLDLSKINQGYLGYLRRIEEVKEAVFTELNKPKISKNLELPEGKETKSLLREENSQNKAFCLVIFIVTVIVTSCILFLSVL